MHIGPYGTTINHQPRFNLEASHLNEKPALRRFNALGETSETHYGAVKQGPITDPITDLIEPNVKFHYSRINSKLPGDNTAVKWQQEFIFTPTKLMVDDVTLKNGPIEVASGSHQGPSQNLWQDRRSRAL